MSSDQIIQDEPYVILTIKRTILLADKLRKEAIYDYMIEKCGSIELLRDEAESLEFQDFMNHQFDNARKIRYADFINWVSKRSSNESSVAVLKKFESDFLLCSLAEVKRYETQLENLDDSLDGFIGSNDHERKAGSRMSTIVNPPRSSRRKRILPGGAGKCRIR